MLDELLKNFDMESDILLRVEFLLINGEISNLKVGVPEGEDFRYDHVVMIDGVLTHNFLGQMGDPVELSMPFRDTVGMLPVYKGYTLSGEYGVKQIIKRAVNTAYNETLQKYIDYEDHMKKMSELRWEICG